MYCVKCGVKLAEHIEACPLCQTPVWNPDNTKSAERSYPAVYPKRPDAVSRRRMLAAFFTILCLLGAGVPVLVCLRLYGGTGWSDFPLFGVSTAYILFVVPMWFRLPRVIACLAADFAAIVGYLYFLCEKTGGSWFLTYGLPITMVLGLFVIFFVGMLGKCKAKRLLLLGTGFCLIGTFCLLVDLFGHLAFGTRLLIWGPYPFGCCLLVGGFFFVASRIRPLREQLERTFFY